MTTNARDAVMASLMLERRRVSDIAKMFGVSVGTVRNALRRQGYGPLPPEQRRELQRYAMRALWRDPDYRQHTTRMMRSSRAARSQCRQTASMGGA
jgi:transposase